MKRLVPLVPNVVDVKITVTYSALHVPTCPDITPVSAPCPDLHRTAQVTGRQSLMTDCNKQKQDNNIIFESHGRPYLHKLVVWCFLGV